MTAADPILRLAFVPADQVCGGAEAGADKVLGGACFSHPAMKSLGNDIPLLGVDMGSPPGQAPFCEIWQSREPLTGGRHGQIRYRRGETLLFGCLDLDEASAAASAAQTAPLQTATALAYGSIFDLLHTLGYGALLRIWNYFPAINRVTHALERYRQFNTGRQDAFIARGRPVVGGVPAACALGSMTGGLQLAFLAARAELTAIENPRQVSAYHYPSQYGPRSPTFSRASLVNLGGRDMLFVSGTASIVGHRTLHDEDAMAQTRESLENIGAVLVEANRRVRGAGFRLEDLAYKVYVRRPRDLDGVRETLKGRIGAGAPVAYLVADICRADLLVEIEASGGHAMMHPDTAGWTA